MTLAADINSSTRTLHTRLNALITSRLASALPPHTSSPHVYTTGILPFARAFFAFEAVWDSICSEDPVSHSPSQSQCLSESGIWIDVDLQASQRLSQEPHTTITQHVSSSSSATPASHVDDAALDIISLLRHLRPDGISRSDRLYRDLSHLLAMPNLTPTSPDSFSILSSLTHSPAATAFVAHIRKSAAERPHVLAAYAFVLYLAVFSGGRWIRMMLASPGLDFWRFNGRVMEDKGSEDNNDIDESVEFDGEDTEAIRGGVSNVFSEQADLEELGLSFWFFSGADDGEDIKAEFKQRLAQFDAKLNEQQRSEVVHEAKEVFIRCEKLILELDNQLKDDAGLAVGMRPLEAQHNKPPTTKKIHPIAEKKVPKSGNSGHSNEKVNPWAGPIVVLAFAGVVAFCAACYSSA